VNGSIAPIIASPCNRIQTPVLSEATILVGIFGYHYIEGWPWIDSFEEAAMLLSGMGPVGQSQTVAGKLFASFYAMWSGLVLVVAMGIILQPFIHRVLHRFHSEK
jgi:hypothetical protein